MKKPKLEFEVTLLGKSNLTGGSVNKTIWLPALNLKVLLEKIEGLNKRNPPGNPNGIWWLYYLTDKQYQDAKA